jgi:hypothetical protein
MRMCSNLVGGDVGWTTSAELVDGKDNLPPLYLTST